MDNLPDVIGDMLHVTHGEMKEETASIMRHMAKELERVRDQLYHLQKTHTLALMASNLYGRGTYDPATIAEGVYRDVERMMEENDTICTPLKGH